LLDQLDEWKRRFGTGDSSDLERLLAEAAAVPLDDAPSLIRLHETALFFRAYPPTRRIASHADAVLSGFAKRVGAFEAAGGDTTPFTEPEVSGIAGTSFSAIFSYEAVCRLVARHADDFEINWDAWDPASAGAVLRRVLPLMEEDWPVEANVPYRDWIEAASGNSNPLVWLTRSFGRLELPGRETAELYDSLRLPVQWTLGDGATTRSRLRLDGRQLFCHRDPLLRRAEVSLARELDTPDLPVRRLARDEARRVLNLIVDTSATRYRELYGFNHPDESRVWHADAGRGVEIFFFGVPPEWRLPLRAYHAGMYFKNRVPSGYIEVLSLFERAEVGFNLYYTFREGESAWIYARLMRLLRQMLGVTSFSVDPYQIGHENHEAIDSGAFWFYRKLGFRPLDPAVATLLAKEERRMAGQPGYRSSAGTLRKLARGYILYERPGFETSDWDRFRVRNLGFALQRAKSKRPALSDFEKVLSLIPDLDTWTGRERTDLNAIVRAKASPDESRYLRLMQRHRRLREALLRLGS
jgi:hypothetical protein